MTADAQYYVVSLKHTMGKRACISLWGANDSGYNWVVPEAGLYAADRISAHAMYYCDFSDDIAVPADAIRALMVPPPPGLVDGDRGAVILNTKENREALIAAATAALARREAVAPPRPDKLFEGHEQAFRDLAEAIGRSEGKALKKLLAARGELLYVGHHGEHGAGDADRKLKAARRAVEAAAPEMAGPAPR